MSDERGHVTEATRQAETEEAEAPHVADQSGASEGEAVEDREVSESVRSHYREMTELGANEPGEGRLP
jgi:hypothetical protein